MEAVDAVDGGSFISPLWRDHCHLLPTNRNGFGRDRLAAIFMKISVVTRN